MSTATATKPSTVRFDEGLKAEASSILEGMGLSFNGYLNLSVRQLVNQRRVPFEIVPAREEPNEETRRAMVEAEARELGIIPDDSPSFTDVGELIAYLEA